MKWLEIIELRSVGTNREWLQSQLQQLIDDLEMEARKHFIQAYHHVTIDADFSIHLLHESDKADNEGSSLGLRLVNALKEFGMVNHNVWIEILTNYKKQEK